MIERRGTEMEPLDWVLVVLAIVLFLWHIVSPPSST